MSLLRKIKSLPDVVAWGLCTGCGSCYSNCDREAVSLVNIEGTGIRPRFDANGCGGCTKCLSICPGYSVDGGAPQNQQSAGSKEFGYALEIWEGYAADPEIRYKASSGGLLTALATYCLEKEGMKSVCHTGREAARPWANETVTSTNRAEVLAHSGSRYAPASPCAGIGGIEASEGPCVFIGKPCDTAAISMMRRNRPALDEKLGLVLTFFCAGTPSTRGTLDLVKSLNTDTEKVTGIRYRGEGWPGNFKVIGAGNAVEASLPYEESWGRLTSYRPLRCNLCPDGLGRVADISCGDAWHRFDGSGDPGRSLVLVRTERGKEILHRAMAAGYVTLVPSGAEAVFKAQKSLLQRRRELYGRLLGMKLLLIPTPAFLNFSLFDSWMRLPLSAKVKTIAGTVRRALTRSWWRRQPLFD